MKTSFFTFIILITFSLSSAQSPVLDTDHMPLVTGPSYYILPAVTGQGGGIGLSPKSFNQKCPLDVVQENNEQRNGLPLNFLLATPNRGGVIREFADLNIRFPVTLTTCGNVAVWRVEDVNGTRVVTSRGTVGNPGAGTLSNWFRIEKYEEGYKIVFCPGVCDGVVG